MSTQEPAAPSNWNVPNALTSLRILLVPFFGWALLADAGESILWRCTAFVIFLGAMITDKVDGSTYLLDVPAGHLVVGDLVLADVVAAEGVDLYAKERA